METIGRILMKRTPNKVPLIFGNSHLGLRALGFRDEGLRGSEVGPGGLAERLPYALPKGVYLKL